MKLTYSRYNSDESRLDLDRLPPRSVGLERKLDDKFLSPTDVVSAGSLITNSDMFVTNNNIISLVSVLIILKNTRKKVSLILH